MSEARLHALHWAFFVDIMAMEFADVYPMFSAWCESVPADEMTGIMALGDELFDDGYYDDDSDDDEDNGDDGEDEDDDEDPIDDVPAALYTEEEIWNDISSNADFSLN